jgi:tetraacyldisaccharide 4'-kinase
MKTPKFWYEPPSWKASIFLPLGLLYNLFSSLRLKFGTPKKFNCFTICVGNLNIGGTGKTPATIALAQHFQARQLNVHIVSRGYKGQFRGTFLVNPKKHKSDQVGDEPLLMSEFTPVWVSEKRKNGIAAAERAGAQIVLLDDGYQDPSINKDFSFVVVDGKKGFGNKKCIPAGPLRENINQGLKRCDALIIVGKIDYKFNDLPKSIKIMHAKLEPLQTGMDWTDGKYLAFAGIADPNKFFATLDSLGANLVDCVALNDHQKLNRKILRRLERDALTAEAQLVTTEKDAVRLPTNFRNKVISVPVRMIFDNESELEHLIKI